MRNIIKLIIILVVVGPLSTMAQQVKQLSIGESLPPLQIFGLINSQDKVLDFLKLKGKAVILDFGNTSCIPCLEALPKLSVLKNKFAGQLEVIMISSEKRTNAEAFFKRRPDVKSLNIPMVIQDTLLRKYFPYLSIPHEVWIDKYGTVQGFTDHHSVTEENVEKLIDGRPLELPIKWDFPYNYKIPLITLNPANIKANHKPEVSSYSFFSKNIPGLTRKFIEDKDTLSGTTRVLALNLEIAEIFLLLSQRYYHTSFQKSHIFSDEGIIKKIFYDESYGNRAVWEQDNTVSFELTFPMKITKIERNLRIKQQLAWFLDLEMTLKNEKVACWVVGVSEEGISNNFNNGKNLKDFLYEANKRPSQIPVIDEIDLPESLKSKLKFDLKEEDYLNLEFLNKKLKPMGLIATQGFREVEIARFSKH
ncbi:TlpA disulfide reductase family protein [Pedobacter sp. Du54]|uniref:TlpA family protein disulfide reductase n=1 Tax=Pedobacter anseongensis TaxID=3133439 RepID=UPI00309DE584